MSMQRHGTTQTDAEQQTFPEAKSNKSDSFKEPQETWEATPKKTYTLNIHEENLL